MASYNYQIDRFPTSRENNILQAKISFKFGLNPTNNWINGISCTEDGKMTIYTTRDLDASEKTQLDTLMASSTLFNLPDLTNYTVFQVVYPSVRWSDIEGSTALPIRGIVCLNEDGKEYIIFDLLDETQKATVMAKLKTLVTEL